MANGNGADFAQMLDLVHPTAESTVLAALIYGNTEQAVEIAKTLEPEDFYGEHHRVIFTAVRRLLEGAEPIDNSAILAECRYVLKETKSKIAISEGWLDLDGDPKRGVAYAKTVKELSWLRQAADYSRWILESLETRPDVSEFFTAAQEKLQQLRPPAQVSSFVYGWETAGEYRRLVEAVARPKNEKVRFDWPWQSWREKVRYLRPGMVGILAAPDGMGKSAFLEEIAEFWALLGFHVVLCHLEDDLQYKKDRRLARWARVEISKIEDEDLTPEELERVRDAEERMAPLYERLHYYHCPGQSMIQITRELEARVREGVCQCVVFDYLDKVQPTRAQARLFAGDPWSRQADDTEQLKTFAERNRLPVMTATQGNKSMQGEGTKTRAAIQGSGQKSQKSQLVLILTRELVGAGGMVDARGNRIAEEGEYSPICQIRIDKQNRGKTGKFEQIMVGAYFSVKDVHFERVEL